MKQGFHLDLERCTGCSACVLACQIENGLQTRWRRVESFNPSRRPHAPVFHLSLACNHCEDAPCARACPTLAYHVDAPTGAVLLDDERCLGCGYCGWVCPYDAPRYEPERGVMGKCTLCHPRLVVGEAPACVTACPTDALRSPNQRDAGTHPLLPGYGPDAPRPRLSLGSLREHRWSRTPPTPAVPPPPARRRRLSLRDEGPLLGFTTLVPVAVGATLAHALGGQTLGPLPALALLLLAASAGLRHLGRPSRSWRALANLNRSWLSREILLLGLFGAALLLAAIGILPSLAAAPCGLALAFAIDRVYDGIRPQRLSSADALPTSLLWAGALLGRPLEAMLLAAGVLLLHLGARPPLRWAVPRIAGGLLLPALLWGARGEPGPWVLGTLLLGCVVDRAGFYRSLRLESPGSALDTLLARRPPA